MLVAQENIELKQKLLKLINPFYTDINNFERYLIIYGLLEKLHKDPKLRKIKEKIKIRNKAKQKSITKSNGLFLYLKKELENNSSFNNDICSCFEALNFVYQSILEIKKASERQSEKIEDKLNQTIFVYQGMEILKHALKIFSHAIFDALDKERLLNEENKAVIKKIKRTYFNEAKSTLFVLGEAVPISTNNKSTNAHKILKHIFIDNADNLDDDFFYSEIAEDEFGDLEHGKSGHSWRRYYDACKCIEKKIIKHTKNSVDNFLVFDCRKTGKVKINLEYLTHKQSM